MFGKTNLLGLLTITLTSIASEGVLTDPFAFSRHISREKQAFLHSIQDPALPQNQSIESGGILRTYGISVPSDYDENSATGWPLILDFHGRDGDADGQWNNSQYYLNPSGREYIVVYPEGCFGRGSRGGPPERAWQGAPYANTSCDDLQFVSDLVTEVQTNYNIDSTRIYASGKSNGGGFVDTLACSPTGDLFAAFAMAAAALYTDPDNVHPDACTGGKRPRMIMEAHGTSDDVIPIRGRTDGSTPNIATWTARWARRNHCDPFEDRTVAYTSWGKNTTYSCDGLIPAIIQQYRVNDLGHCWPSLTNNTDTPMHGTSCLVQTLDFTQAVVDFFATWPKAESN